MPSTAPTAENVQQDPAAEIIDEIRWFKKIRSTYGWSKGLFPLGCFVHSYMQCSAMITAAYWKASDIGPCSFAARTVAFDRRAASGLKICS
jgi:hypothetical protein